MAASWSVRPFFLFSAPFPPFSSSRRVWTETFRVKEPDRVGPRGLLIGGFFSFSESFSFFSVSLAVGLHAHCVESVNQSDDPRVVATGQPRRREIVFFSLLFLRRFFSSPSLPLPSPRGCPRGEEHGGKERVRTARRRRCGV